MDHTVDHRDGRGAAYAPFQFGMVSVAASSSLIASAFTISESILSTDQRTDQCRMERVCHSGLITSAHHKPGPTGLRRAFYTRPMCLNG